MALIEDFFKRLYIFGGEAVLYIYIGFAVLALIFITIIFLSLRKPKKLKLSKEEKNLVEEQTLMMETIKMPAIATEEPKKAELTVSAPAPVIEPQKPTPIFSSVYLDRGPIIKPEENIPLKLTEEPVEAVMPPTVAPVKFPEVKPEVEPEPKSSLTLPAFEQPKLVQEPVTEVVIPELQEPAGTFFTEDVAEEKELSTILNRLSTMVESFKEKPQEEEPIVVMPKSEPVVLSSEELKAKLERLQRKIDENQALELTHLLQQTGLGELDALPELAEEERTILGR